MNTPEFAYGLRKCLRIALGDQQIIIESFSTKSDNLEPYKLSDCCVFTGDKVNASDYVLLKGKFSY